MYVLLTVKRSNVVYKSPSCLATAMGRDKTEIRKITSSRVAKMLKTLSKMDSQPEHQLLWEDKEVKFDTPNL